MLHLIKTKGKGQSIKDVKALNKQQIKALATNIKIMQQLVGFHGLTTIFFSQYSYGTQSIISLSTLIKKNKQAFKAKEQANAKFCSKFLYAVDSLFQLWLEECSTCNQCNKVDNDLLNFRNLVKAVRFGTFKLKLPSSFTQPKEQSAATPVEPNKAVAAKEKGNKKQGKERRSTDKSSTTHP
jgi:hypothetical protein